MDVALQLIGTRSALALLRAALCGARRFDELIESAGVSTMIASARLHEFVDAGLMTKRPYKSRQRTRHEYVLTDLGLRCLPVVVALMEVGRAVAPDSTTTGLLHAGCGAEFVQEMHCTGGHSISRAPGNHRPAYQPGYRPGGRSANPDRLTDADPDTGRRRFLSIAWGSGTDMENDAWLA
jgi:DNA-binding HxlR family transcriptional regulator